MKTQEQIDAEWSFLTEHKIYAWGVGTELSNAFLSFVKNLNLPLVAFCDNNKALWGTEYGGYPVISPDEFQDRLKKDPDLLMQITVRPYNKSAVLAQVEGYGVKHIIPSLETDERIRFYLSSMLNEFARGYDCSAVCGNHDVFSLKATNEITTLLNIEEQLECKKNVILVCHPPKTADTTVYKTFQKEKIPHIYCQHNPEILSSTKGRTKVTMAIREPIIRDLSEMFQNIEAGTVLLQKFSFEQIQQSILTDHYQCFFEVYLTRETGKIGSFFNRCKEHGIDVLGHPFDQEKGYSTFQIENFDVFFYQLEKLNDLIPELSAWTGTYFTELVNSNVASEKWVANSYKKAQKNMKITQEYFDQCYNDPYVQHCYSKEDIEKFKDRWRGNIQ